jgi:hypothetical protein
MVLQHRDGRLPFRDCLGRLRRRRLPCETHREEAGDSRDHEQDRGHDQKGGPEWHGLVEPRRGCREQESERIDDEDEGAQSKPTRDPERRRLLLRLELRQLENQQQQRARPPPDPLNPAD